MREALSSLAEKIRKDQSALHESTRRIREERPELIAGTEMVGISLDVCAVDGGLLAYRLHGHDVVAVRSVAVDFVYGDSTLRSFDYHPSRSPPISLFVESALDEHEANVFRSLIRLKSELSCALEAVERFSPKLMLMDGSLWTVPSDRPGRGSALGPLYGEVMGLYKKLFGECEREGVLLCGVIKDSRSRKLASSLGFSCSDTVLCSHMLEKGERIKAFPYFDEKQKEPEGYAERLMVSYIKPSEHDLPLRIEFLSMGDDEQQVASLISSLSSISESFAYPAVLIEADMRAVMDRAEGERLQADLRTLEMRPLRRNSRPFR
ncbi:MAG: DNA double-strand break repair nuclease NurA [Candidatus Micrarchaeota archaeon]